MTGNGEGEAPQETREAECPQAQSAQGQQRQPAVREQADEQIGGRQGEHGISPATVGITPGQGGNVTLTRGHCGGFLP